MSENTHQVMRSETEVEDTQTLAQLALGRIVDLCEKWIDKPALRRGAAAQEILEQIHTDPMKDMMLESIGPSAKGGLELNAVAGGPESEGVVLAMSNALGEMLDTNGADNYVEFTVEKRGRPTYTVCVRRHHKPSPHDFRVQAEAKVAEIREHQVQINFWDDEVSCACGTEVYTEDGYNDHIGKLLGKLP